MAGANVSIDALQKVKIALNEYNIDLSGFADRIGKQASSILQSAECKMKTIANQLEETEKQIIKFKHKIAALDMIISRLNQEIDYEDKEGQKQIILDISKIINETIYELEDQAKKSGNSDIIENIISDYRRVYLTQAEEHLNLIDQGILPMMLNKILDWHYRYVEQEKEKTEKELQTTQKFLNRLQNKQDRMKSNFRQMNDDLQQLLLASKSFETRATSETEKNVGNIDKCIMAIDTYLNG